MKNKEKFTTKKDDITIVGKLTEEELQNFIKTGKLPDRIKNKTEGK